MGRISLISSIKRYVKGLQPIYVYPNVVELSTNTLLRDKNAVVIGASRGIGKAISETFIKSGATVVAIAKNESNLLKAKDEIRSEKYLPYTWDINELNDLPHKIKEISSKFTNREEIDILVIAAGVKNGQEQRYWDFSQEDFNETISVNVKAPFFITREIIKHMISKDIKGHIVNVVGIKGFIGEASPYSISKFGMTSLTKGLARMFADKGIVINGVAPGGTMTDMANLKTDNYFHPATANGRLASPKEIANVVLFLASDLGNNLVGSIIVSDGGEMLQYNNNRY